MSYIAIVEMATNNSLITRIAACAAQEGATEAVVQWAQQNVWQIVASPGWADAWDYAKATTDVNHNPDIGMRTDVISDGMILAAVSPLLTS